MKSWFYRRWHNYHYHFHPHAAPVLLLLFLAWGSALAGSITIARVTLSDPRPSSTGVSYRFDFLAPSSTPIKSFKAEVCTDTTGSCITPAGFSAGSSLLASQPTGLGDPGGWVSDATIGALRTKNNANITPVSGNQSLTFAGVNNPDSGATYFIRLTTYSDDNYAMQLDSATITFSTNPAVTVDVTVDPTLSFSVAGVPTSTTYKGGLATSDRCVDTPNSITFGTSTQPLSADTDYDCAQTLTTSTNASTGYQVTVSGVVPGNDLINAGNNSVAVQDWTGTNSAPAPTPNGPGAELFGYTTDDSQLSGAPNRFTAADNLFAGLTPAADEVAYANAPVADRTVNVGYRLRFQLYSPPGSYVGRVIYTCTATF